MERVQSDEIAKEKKNESYKVFQQIMCILFKMKTKPTFYIGKNYTQIKDKNISQYADRKIVSNPSVTTNNY
jgi:hypothetical protein